MTVAKAKETVVSIAPVVMSSAYEVALKLCDPSTKIEESAEAVRQIVKVIDHLKDTADRSRFLIGGMLLRLVQDNRWRHLTPDKSFGEFCHDVIGISADGAKYLVEVHGRSIKLGFSVERLESIGWSKARQFLQVATHETVEEWASKSKDMTIAEVGEAVRKEKAKRRGKTIADQKESFAVRVEKDQLRNIEGAVETAIVIAQKQSGSDTPIGRGTALDLICTDWLANHIEEADRTIGWFCKNLERVFDVKLEVTGPRKRRA